MKYANILFQPRRAVNLGDTMQLLAIDSIYKNMGINPEDIVYIDYRDLQTYDGEYCVLPVNMPLDDYVQGGIAGRFSKKIIPVFLGLTLSYENLSVGEVDYLKSFEPIGCRDECTLNVLRKYHILSYLSGCITFTLPEREYKESANKVYIIDADRELLKRVPSNFFEGKEIVRRRHNLFDFEESVKLKDYVFNQYQEYKDSAALVITSLLHAAIPCFTAGIPTILLKKEVTYRMSWIEKLIPVYTEDTIDTLIDAPRMTEKLRAEKQNILQFYMLRIKSVQQKYSQIFEISDFYENRNKQEHYTYEVTDDMKKYIDSCVNKQEWRGGVFAVGATRWRKRYSVISQRKDSRSKTV